MDLENISIKVAGEAGQGIFTIGFLISKIFKNVGFNVVCTKSYSSLIQGGHNSCFVKVGLNKNLSEQKALDFLICLDVNSFNKYCCDLKKNSVLIVPDDLDFDFSLVDKNVFVLKVPILDLLENCDKMFVNSIYFGVFCSIFDFDFKFLSLTFDRHFKKKLKVLVDKNKDFSKVGFDFMRVFKEESSFDFSVFKNFFSQVDYKNKKNKGFNCDCFFLSGNDACCIGSLKAGVKFVSGYPMTPASSFLNFFSFYQRDYNIVFRQTEDEIAAINSIIGASIAGARSMTATSGGGFALMSEGLGFASMSETGIVCFMSQRTGPSTGLPTFTDQSDLKFVLNASSGDLPIIVLAPSDISDCFYMSFEAFNLADVCQTPVVVLLDKFLSSSYFSCDNFDVSNLKINRGKFINLNSKENLKDFKRYKFSSDGISERCCLSFKNNFFVSSSYEHDESGFTCEMGINHKLMQEKRFKKLDVIDKNLIRPKIYGDEDADLTVVSWGSNKGVILEAIDVLRKKGFKINFMNFVFINPFDEDFVFNFLKSSKKVLILELNFTAQLRGIILERCNFNIENTFLKYDGRSFFLEEVVDRFLEELN